MNLICKWHFKWQKYQDPANCVTQEPQDKPNSPESSKCKALSPRWSKGHKRTQDGWGQNVQPGGRGPHSSDFMDSNSDYMDYSSTSPTKLPGHQKTNRRRLWKVREGSRLTRVLTRNDTVASSLGFLFALYSLDLELQKMAAGNTNGFKGGKKAPTKASSFQPRDQERGSQTRQKSTIVVNNQLTPQKELWPNPTSTGCSKAPQHLPPRGCPEKAKKRAGTFLPASSNESPVPRVSKDIQVADEHMERNSPSLVTRETHIETMMRENYMPIRMAKIKISDNTKCWRGCRETRSRCWLEHKTALPLCKTAFRFLKKKKKNTQLPQTSTLQHLSQRNEDLCYVHITPLHECLWQLYS